MLGQVMGSEGARCFRTDKRWDVIGSRTTWFFFSDHELTCELRFTQQCAIKCRCQIVANSISRSAISAPPAISLRMSSPARPSRTPEPITSPRERNVKRSATSFE